ncbi:hypothetical protein [Methylophilus sp. Leaf408]|nr:hypothetical protein [Methylophilus sp. Leaf408]
MSSNLAGRTSQKSKAKIVITNLAFFVPILCPLCAQVVPTIYPIIGEVE